MNRAIAIKHDGTKITFRCNEAIRNIFCHNMKLKELYIGKGVVSVACQNNDLIEIDVPYGLHSLRCNDNQLKALNVPDSILWLWCDKELIDYDTCKIKTVNIFY